MPNIYVPREIIIHVKDVMKRKKADTLADGFRYLAQYARVGKEVENISKFSFPVDNLPPLFKSRKTKRRF